ncbi:MAG: exonuclease SbcCD subunit D C-terminal domain-containing protein [Phaeodactylibacter sp.]|nr:exonuclease SbcCD subunit D C-terminal domain-containing protein [Phaeodactylibacter sp.]MCB9274846.1 exonuclease SbcCD subunit D C-terminal domain-containing protein [Lewinellaceae bacterium]
MKIIHTSDWHLGQKFLYNGREAEHQMALDWLVDTIRSREVDGLIVAGDVFDIGNPPNYARRMYYRFLTQLIPTTCRHVLATGGNHDSPAMLEAPRDLLQALNIDVLGAITGALEDEAVEWRNEKGALEAVIAAVPFLRDRDLHFSVAGENGMERVDRLKNSIREHYRSLGRLIEERYAGAGVPLIATGHLYATGAQASGAQDNIYIGNKENIDARDFPEVFAYVALGHIHRPQAVGGLEHVRYSGSLIPLSFSETKDDKSVYLLEFEGAMLKKVEALELPTFRRLKTIQGPLEKVEEALKRFAGKQREGLAPWVEVIVETDRLIPQLDQRLHELTADKHLELLKIRLFRLYQAAQQEQLIPELGDLEELEVFKMKCQSYGSPPEEMDELVQTFLELREWMAGQEQGTGQAGTRLGEGEAP